MDSQEVAGIPKDSQEVSGTPKVSGIPKKSKGFPGSLSPSGTPKKSQGVPNIYIYIYIILSVFTLIGTKKTEKPRKAQKASGRPESPGNARKPREGQRRPPGAPWTFLGLPGPRSLPDPSWLPGPSWLPELPGVQGSEGSTGYNGPSERDCKEASIRGASMRGFY